MPAFLRRKTQVCAIWPSAVDGKIHYGLGLGQAGIALFLLRLHERTGEEAREYRLSGQSVCMDWSSSETAHLPSRLRDLLRRSFDLYRRVGRLEAQIDRRLENLAYSETGRPEERPSNSTRRSAWPLNFWWTQQELNLRPSGCQPDALPTELWARQVGDSRPLSRRVKFGSSRSCPAGMDRGN